MMQYCGYTLKECKYLEKFLIKIMDVQLLISKKIETITGLSVRNLYVSDIINHFFVVTVYKLTIHRYVFCKVGFGGLLRKEDPGVISLPFKSIVILTQIYFPKIFKMQYFKELPDMKESSLNSSRSWAIAWLCSFINFLQLGVARLSGLMFLAAMPRYEVNRTQASLPFVLCYTVRTVSGPLIGYLGRRIEIRKIIVFGCILSAVGVGSCFLADDITAVAVLWGAVYGLGLGLSTILIPQILNQHFDKYISNANGISLAGECVAGFVLPVFVEHLLSAYGISGSFLILSGLILHSVPAALLLNLPIPRAKSPKHENLRESKDKTFESGLESSSGISGIYFRRHDKDICSKRIMYETSFSANEKYFTPSITSARNDIAKDNLLPNSALSSEDLIVVSFKTQTKDDKGLLPISKSECAQEEHSLDKLKHDDVARADVSHSSGHSGGNQYYGSLDVSNKTAATLDSSSKQKPAFYSFLVFLDPAFVLIIITQSSIIFIGTSIITIIVEFSRDAGLSSSEEIYILMCLSISDMIGRFGLGWVTDGGYMSKVTFSAACYFLMGVLFVGLTFFKTFSLLMSGTFFIGLALGGILIVSPGIVSDVIKEDKITMALASRFLLYAPMSLTQSSLIGYFRGTLGSYEGILYILALNCLFCTIMSLLTPVAAGCGKNKRKTGQEL